MRRRLPRRQRFHDAGDIDVTIAMEDTIMNDDVLPGARQCEELRLIKAFLRLTDSGGRKRVLELAEQLAEDAECTAPGSVLAVTVTPSVDPARDFPPLAE
jgi:hypothetical protein